MGRGHQRGVPASRQSPPAATVSDAVKVRPLPSGRVMLSRPCKRYYGPLRLPARPGSISAAPYTSPLSVSAHLAGSPVVPAGAVFAGHPCSPGGPPVTGQRRGSPERRSSSPDNGVDALTEVHEATPGFAARYGLRGCALTSVSARQGTWCFGLPGVPTQWVPSLKLPGRAARSRGRTFTGKFQRIHGILSGTFLFLRRERAPPGLREQLGG